MSQFRDKKLKQSILKFWRWLFLSVMIATPASASAAKPLQVLMTDDIYPYAYRTEQEIPAGLLVDLWQEIAKQAQVELTIDMVDRQNHV